MHKSEIPAGDAKAKAEAVLQQMLAQDAFSRLLGLEVEAVDAGYCNGFGILHGGVSYAAADSALAFACNSHGRLSVALSTSMDYLEPGQLGDMLTVEAQEQSLKNKVSVYNIRVTNQKGVLVALFKGTAYRTGKELLAGEE
jgi:acyl-CoA thioesterase